MHATAGPPPGPAPIAVEAPREHTAALFTRLSEQLSTLVRQEVALAKLELAAKGRRLGQGLGLVGTAGVLAFYGVGAALVTAGLALALVVAGWLAALIVTGAVFLLAAILALLGKTSIERSAPPVPTEAVANVKADIAVVKERRRG